MCAWLKDKNYLTQVDISKRCNPVNYLCPASLRLLCFAHKRCYIFQFSMLRIVCNVPCVTYMDCMYSELSLPFQFIF